MTRLRIREGGRSRDLEVEGSRLTLGRAPDCDVVIASTNVSRRHAELWMDTDGCTLSDLGSVNGTFIGEERIASERIGPGVVFRLGSDVSVELLPAYPEPSEPEAPAPPLQREREREREPAPPLRAAAPPRPAEPEAGQEEGEDADERDEEAPAPARDSWRRRTRYGLVPAGGGDAWIVRRGVTTVGRDEGAGITLDDGSVSRLHARLDFGDAGLRLTDLKSGNGTFVNDAPVTVARLVPGDRVRFGDAEFEVERWQEVAWDEVLRPLLVLVALVVLAVVGVLVTRALVERGEARRAGTRLRVQAVENVRKAIEATRANEPEVARGYLRHTADVLELAGLLPENASPDQPATLLRPLAADLDERERAFDFSALFDTTLVRREAESVEALPPRAFVEHQLRCWCADLGQDAELPPEFVDQVWGFIQGWMQQPGEMRLMLERSRTLQPRIVAVLARHRLPPMVAYVAWVESRLDTTCESPAHAVGLWQLMAETARDHGLRVDPSNLRRDQRTRLEPSTDAAARYIASMLKDQGPEYFMLVLASYNRGPTYLRDAKQKVDQPMLTSTSKYWYLVKNRLLAPETRQYVPKIFAVRLIAEYPRRFGF